MGVVSGIFERTAEMTSVEVSNRPVNDRGLERPDLTERWSATPILQAWRVARDDAQEELDIEDLASCPVNIVT